MRQHRATSTHRGAERSARADPRSNLIKEYRPRFNIALRDDKSYPYIKVTVQEPFPRVLVTRRLVDDGARYFGPYTDVGAMRRALNVVKRIFTVRSCHYDASARSDRNGRASTISSSAARRRASGGRTQAAYRA